MATFHKVPPFAPLSFISEHQRHRHHHCFSPLQPPPYPKKHHNNLLITKSSTTICCSKYGNFLDLKPELGQYTLDFPHLPTVDRSNRLRFDVVIIGTGPGGLRLAEQLSLYGIKVCCIDPSPLSMWPNNYGAWVDELEGLGDLGECFDKKWPLATVYIDDRTTKYLDRPYGRVNRKKLKMKLLENCASNGTVSFHAAKVWKVQHQEFESSVACDDGTELKASLVVDASGFASPFIEYNKSPRNCGFQIAHGILAEVDSHPFDLDKMVLMDWRDSHMGNEPYLRTSNSRFPTFLYAMPFDSNLIFLEETSLVSRPALSYVEVKKRMVARLRHLGINVKKVIEVEKCLIPMGGPLPQIPQSVVGIGSTGGLVHPSTGYTMAITMVLAPVMAHAIAQCLGSTRMIRGKSLHQRAWNALWPMKRRSAREFYAFGMETLLKLDLDGTRRFFDAFFELDPHYWHGFLSSRLSIGELALLSMSLFRHASNPSKLDIITKCPPPLVKMISKLAVDAAAT
ncbi:unnamed protein product [Rhodiola kirilowii]